MNAEEEGWWHRWVFCCCSGLKLFFPVLLLYILLALPHTFGVFPHSRTSKYWVVGKWRHKAEGNVSETFILFYLFFVRALLREGD